MEKPSLGKTTSPNRLSKSVKAKTHQPTLGTGAAAKNANQVTKQIKQPMRQPIAAGLRMQVLQQDNFRCRICGASADEGARLEVDHIVPVSRGGTNDRNNLQTLCEKCNVGKSNHIL